MACKIKLKISSLEFLTVVNWTFFFGGGRGEPNLSLFVLGRCSSIEPSHYLLSAKYGVSMVEKIGYR